MDQNEGNDINKASGEPAATRRFGASEADGRGLGTGSAVELKAEASAVTGRNFQGFVRR